LASWGTREWRRVHGLVRESERLGLFCGDLGIEAQQKHCGENKERERMERREFG
jgi:hypothetical protein